jgi:hypothetical protein
VRRRTRGSAYIYVLLMVVAVTTVGLAVADATINSILAQKRVLNRVAADYLLQGGADHLEALRVYSRLSVPSTHNITLDGTNVKIALTAGATSNTMNAAISCEVGGQSFTRRLVTGRSRPTPFHFAMAAVNTIVEDLVTCTVGSATSPASVYCGSSVAITNSTSKIWGDVESKGTINATLETSGTKYQNISEDIFTTSGLLDYLTLASTKYLLNQDWNGFAFNSVASGSPYHLVHITGNLRLKGVISGRGTIYVTGSVTVTGPITYADANSKLVIIAQGTIGVDFDSYGYFYGMGAVTLNNGADLVGGLYTTNTLKLKNSSTVIYDPYIANNPSEGALFRLPGY